jgi:hypothetical protein
MSIVWLGSVAQWMLELLPKPAAGLIIHSVWMLLVFASVLQYGSQFLYRYLLVCCDWRLHFHTYLAIVLSVPLCIVIAFLYMASVFADDPTRIRNPMIVDALGMPLPPPGGFIARTEVSIF